MVSYSGIIPLLHKECKLLGKVPLLLDDKIAIRSVKPEHVGPIIAARKSLTDRVNQKTKCILIEGGEQPITADEMDDVALCGSFVLNVFSGAGAIVLGPAFSIRHIQTFKVDVTHDVNAYIPISSPKFEIEAATIPQAFKETYLATKAAVAKDPSLRISLRKFNSSVLKQGVEDRILDMSICLESMTTLDTEISFRFSLYSALLADTEPAKRRAMFKMLRKFYGERSNLVHGNKEANAEWIENHWRAIIRTAKLAILAKIDFLGSNESNAWQPHLDGLAFGELLQQENADAPGDG